MWNKFSAPFARPASCFGKYSARIAKLSTVAAPTAATTAHCKYDGKGKRRINANCVAINKVATSPSRSNAACRKWRNTPEARVGVDLSQAYRHRSACDRRSLGHHEIDHDRTSGG